MDTELNQELKPKIMSFNKEQDQIFSLAVKDSALS